MPDNFIKVTSDPNFFKDFELESPVEALEKEIEQAKEKIEATGNPIEVQSIEALAKELENSDDLDGNKSDDATSKENKEDKSKKEDKTNSSDDEYSYKPFIDIMAESGILDLPEDEEVGDSAEDLVSLFETTVTTRIKDGIEEYKESIPELGKNFLEYLELGGDPKKYIEAQTGPLDISDLDLSTIEHQKLVLREYLKTQDYSNEEIKEELQDYEDSLLLEKKAKTAATKLEKIFDQQKVQLVNEQKEIIKQREKELEQYVDSVKSIIKTSTIIAGLEVSDKEKKEFENYLLKQDKTGSTQYQKEYKEDPIKTQIELAYLKYKKYDFAKAAAKGETQAAKKLKDLITNKNETTVKGSTNRNENNAADLSAFQKMFKKETK